MSNNMKTVAYRSVVLPGLGRVKVPEGVTDAEVLDQVMNAEDEATPLNKTKKKS